MLQQLVTTKFTITLVAKHSISSLTHSLTNV